MRVGLRGKILGGYLVLICFVAIIGVLSYLNGVNSREQFEALNEDVIPNLGISYEIKAGLAGEANDTRGFLLTGNDEFLKGIQNKADELDKLIQEKLPNMEDDEQEVLKQVQASLKIYTARQMRAADMYKNGKIDEAMKISFEEARDIRKNEVYPLLEQFEENVDEDLTEHNETMEAVLQSNLTKTVATATASVIIGIFLGLYIPNRVLKPIKLIINQSERLAKGDFSVQALQINTNDETRELAESFNTMVENVRELISKVFNNANQVTSTSIQMSSNAGEASKATQQVASAIQEVAKGSSEQTGYVNSTMEIISEVDKAVRQIATGAQEQVESVTQTADMINQMAQGIDDVANSAQTVSGSAERTKGAAEKGEDAVNLTIKGMDGIKTKVFETAEQIRELGEHSQQIGEIIQVIDDIAEQTNLLALNAAIEAARAGEHGKGFAVVADEVRKLAERSGKATKEIADLIITIQKVTEGAVAAMEQGTDEVEQGSKLAHDAGDALNEILSTVEETYQQIQNISAGAEQISASTEGVVKSVERVSAIAQENTTAADQLTSASKEVASSMENLSSITEESAATTEEVSASTEEMNASVEEIASFAQSLASTADTLSELVGHFQIRQITENCWEIMNCPEDRQQKCPAFKGEEKRCWLIPNTWCGGVQQADVESKRHRCMKCKTFKLMNEIDEPGFTKC